MKPLFASLPLVVCLVSVAGQPDPNLYEKIDAKLAADPVLAAAVGKAGPEMASVNWLLGEWDVIAEVQATNHVSQPEHGRSRVVATLDGTVLEQRDTYPSGTQDLCLLSYSPVTRQWSNVVLDSAGDAIVIRGRATATGFVFEGDVTIVGVDTHLRQTVTRDGNDVYRVVNEERAADGSWRLLDTYRYARIKQP